MSAKSKYANALSEGDAVGDWTVLGVGRERINGAVHSVAFCVCKCGTERAHVVATLMRGRSMGCGCAARRATAARKTSHGCAANYRAGRAADKLYSVWNGIKQRTGNPRCSNYQNYGGRGIWLCEAWQDFAIFREWALRSGYRDGLSIERVDCDGPYAEFNCSWADAKTQARNKRSNTNLTALNKTQCLAAWAEEIGVKAATIACRLRMGWSEEEAVTRPLRGHVAHAPVLR